MVLVNVIPGTKLPLARSQGFTYELASPATQKNDEGTETRRNVAGQVVSIPLGRRQVWGVVSDEIPASPKNFAVKMAKQTGPSIPVHNIALAKSMAREYRVPLSQVVKLLVPPGQPGLRDAKERKKKQIVPVVVSSNIVPITQILLSAAQQRASDAIAAGLETNQAFLLHGVTGSGKTEVYASVAKKVIEKGGQVLFLVPEIAMTPQLAQRLENYLGHIVTWHSGITLAQKKQAWSELSAGKPAVVVGPRSALFLPLPKLGLVIVDEEHDASYKQWDQEPRFHGRAVARMLSLHAKCPVVFGSATPSLESWYLAKNKKIKKLELPDRYGASVMPDVEFIDVRGLPPTPVSPPTIEAIRQALSEEKQAMVLLNRRGSNRVLMCRDCGHIWRCQKCERSMVFHSAPTKHLACHFCEIKTALPKSCPSCKGLQMLGYGFGTERIEQELTAQFPGARIARLDRDISRSPRKLKEVTSNTLSGKVDILVGTQLIAKGWDLEKLELVIVLDADQGLLLPDFRSHERTMQLLWQVAGRSGRRETKGRVLIETMHLDHPTLRAVQSHDFVTFAEKEIAERKKFGYPPFRRVMKIQIDGNEATRQKQDVAIRAALEKILDQKSLQDVTDVLPTEDLILPRGKVISQIIVLTTDPSLLFAAIPADVTLDVDPEQV